MEGDEVDPAIFLDYEGRRIWFATDVARQLFEMAPDDYVANLPPVARWVEARVVATGPAEPGERMGVTTVLGRLHPAFVHFPVALLMAAAAAELLGLLRWRRDAMRIASAWCIALAAMGCVPAVASGLILAEARGAGGDAAAAELLQLHRLLGIATGASCLLSALLLSWSTRPKWGRAARRFYTVSVLGGAALVALTGHFGAMLVYGRDWLPF